MSYDDGTRIKCDCPVCKSKGKTRSSNKIDDVNRHLYFVCENIKCNTRWRMTLSFDGLIQNKKLSSDRMKVFDPDAVLNQAA